MPVQIAPGLSIGLPTVTSFTPTSGSPATGIGYPTNGTLITVTGTNLHTAWKVLLSGRFAATVGTETGEAPFAAVPINENLASGEIHWGRLTLPATGSPTWGTQLTFTLPPVKATADQWLQALVTGPIRILNSAGMGPLSSQILTIV